MLKKALGFNRMNELVSIDEHEIGLSLKENHELRQLAMMDPVDRHKETITNMLNNLRDNEADLIENKRRIEFDIKQTRALIEAYTQALGVLNAPEMPQAQTEIHTSHFNIKDGA